MAAAEVDKAINEQLKESYGAKADSIAKIKEGMAKAEYDAYKQKIEHLRGILKERRDLVKDLKTFWYDSLMQSNLNPAFIDPQDQEALKALTDVDVHFEQDPRAFTMTFTFGENRYFSDSRLAKSFSVAPNQPKFEQMSLNAELKGKAVSISWKGDGVNLVKHKPRPKLNEAEEFDDIEVGSFFNWFTEEEDPQDLNAHLLEWYLSAHDLFARLEGPEMYDDDDASEDEEEDGDDDKSIDLEEEEAQRAKKRRKN